APADGRHGGRGRQRPGGPHRRLGGRGPGGGRPMAGAQAGTRGGERPARGGRDHMHEALIIYGLAMGYDSAVVAGRYGYAIQHTDRPGFRAVGGFGATPAGGRRGG